MTNSTNRRILIVDDQESIHDDFRSILAVGEVVDDSFSEDEAFLFGELRVSSTSDTYQLDSAFQEGRQLPASKQALAEKQPYAVAFIDVRMPPGIDGVETIEQIRRLTLAYKS